MRKLNLLNKIYLLIFLALVIATVVKVYLSYRNNMDRYYYSVNLTAPYTYPVYIQQAYLVSQKGEQLDIDDNRVSKEDSYWCRVSDYQITDKQPLPKALVLAYASLRDKKYYRDSIPLPATLIDSVFKTAEAKGIAKSIISNTGSVNGLVFLIGIANNGNILVWLQGKKYERKLVSQHIAPQKPVGTLTDGDRVYNGEHFFDVFFHQDDVKKAVACGTDSHANYADSATHYLELQ